MSAYLLMHKPDHNTPDGLLWFLYSFRSFNYDFSLLSVNESNYVVGLEYVWIASDYPPIVQIWAMLPEIKQRFPNASGVELFNGQRVNMEGFLQ